MNDRYRLRTAGLEVVMIALGITYLIPLYVGFITAFKSPRDAAAHPLTPPTHLDLTNFTQAWNQANLGPAFLTSFIVTAISVALLVVFGSLAAYTLARRTKRLSNGIFLLFLVGLILPFQLGTIPLYTLMRDAKLLGTYQSLIIFYLGYQMPFTVFLYTGFLRTVPMDYEESAMLDGADRFRAFWLVVFPLLRPITGTVIILNAVTIWNDFFTPLLFMAGSSHQTLPVAVYSFVGQYSTQWNLIFAGVVLSVLPMLILFFALQRSFIKSFASTLKG